MSSERLSNMFRAIQPGLGQALQYSINKEMEASLAARQENLMRLRQKHELARDERRYTEAEQARLENQTFQKDLFGMQTEAADTRAQMQADRQDARWTREDAARIRAQSASTLRHYDDQIFKLQMAADKMEADDSFNADKPAILAGMQQRILALQGEKSQATRSMFESLQQLGDPAAVAMDTKQVLSQAGYNEKQIADMMERAKGGENPVDLMSPPGNLVDASAVNPDVSLGGVPTMPVTSVGADNLIEKANQETESGVAPVGETPVPVQAESEELIAGPLSYPKSLPTQPRPSNAGLRKFTPSQTAEAGPNRTAETLSGAADLVGGIATDVGRKVKDKATEALSAVGAKNTAKREAEAEAELMALTRKEMKGGTLRQREHARLAQLRKLYPELAARIEGELKPELFAG